LQRKFVILSRKRSERVEGRTKLCENFWRLPRLTPTASSRHAINIGFDPKRFEAVAL